MDEIIASIPKNIKKSMVLYITTWQEKPEIIHNKLILC